MRKIIKKVIICGLSALTMVAQVNVFAASLAEAPLEDEPVSTSLQVSDKTAENTYILGTSSTEKAGNTLNIQYHTPGEIKAFIEAHPVRYLSADYTTEPSVDAKNPGVLKDDVITDALNAVNVCRYIAGLSYNITIDKDEQEKAQAGAFINYVNGGLSHSPGVPNGWSEKDATYVRGLEGASSCNLGMGYSTLARAVFEGWMYDGNSSNIDRVGHRRWVLNPYMTTTGFGQAGAYTSMYAFGYDHMGSRGYSSNETNRKVSVWPAPNMPIDYFSSSYPWSYSSSESEYGDIKVTLKNTSTGQTWNFSRNEADGYFNVENSNYGIKGCVIFRPNDVTIRSGDKYEVSITGLNKGDVKYSVYFFSLDAVEASVPDSDFDPTKDDYQGWYIKSSISYWYEHGIRQGTYDDPKGVIGDGTVRGREIYDPVSDGWYWLDSIYDGAKAVGKEVWMPYIYQNEKDWDEATMRKIAYESDEGMGECVLKAMLDHSGKWVRYDEKGRMLKGWVTITGTLARIYPDQEGNTYYYDHRTGLMAKGLVEIDGVPHYFDEISGVIQW